MQRNMSDDLDEQTNKAEEILQYCSAVNRFLVNNYPYNCPLFTNDGELVYQYSAPERPETCVAIDAIWDKELQVVRFADITNLDEMSQRQQWFVLISPNAFCGLVDNPSANYSRVHILYVVNRITTPANLVSRGVLSRKNYFPFMIEVVDMLLYGDLENVLRRLDDKLIY